MAKDFSPPAGRRLRIPLTFYDPKTRNFRVVPEATALVTVEDLAEQKRLWKAIEKTIGDGDWKNDRVASGGGSALPASAHV